MIAVESVSTKVKAIQKLLKQSKRFRSYRSSRRAHRAIVAHSRYLRKLSLPESQGDIARVVAEK